MDENVHLWHKLQLSSLKRPDGKYLIQILKRLTMNILSVSIGVSCSVVTMVLLYIFKETRSKLL